MDNISKQEKEFLRKVYCKANCLEYEKRQQELIKENEKRIRIRKIKDYFIFSFLFMIMVLISSLNDFDIRVVIVCLSILMWVISYYEYDGISEINIKNTRWKYENRNKQPL